MHRAGWAWANRSTLICGLAVRVACQAAKSVGFACDVQVLPGATGAPWDVTDWDDTICDPFICHSTSAPVVLCCQRMSESPEPLKSPISTIFQLESGDTALP